MKTSEKQTFTYLLFKCLIIVRYSNGIWIADHVVQYSVTWKCLLFKPSHELSRRQFCPLFRTPFEQWTIPCSWANVHDLNTRQVCYSDPPCTFILSESKLSLLFQITTVSGPQLHIEPEVQAWREPTSQKVHAVHGSCPQEVQHVDDCNL